MFDDVKNEGSGAETAVDSSTPSVTEPAAATPAAVEPAADPGTPSGPAAPADAAPAAPPEPAPVAPSAPVVAAPAAPEAEPPAPEPAPAAPQSLGDKLAEMSGEEARAVETKWYVVTTYSGFEHKAKQALEERIGKSSCPELFGQVLVPTEPPPEGKKKSAGRSFFPGYIFVEMVMNEQTWTLVKGTPRVTNFVGNQKPTPVPAEQIHEIQRQISEGAIKAKPEVVFSEGDRVRVSHGPFMNMNGTVSSINPVKQVVRVLVSIFGRATPVELEFHQVEKLP
jgi:transcriptional antiterminator NusG